MNHGHKDFFLYEHTHSRRFHYSAIVSLGSFGIIKPIMVSWKIEFRLS